MNNDQQLRRHLQRLLEWQDAHLNFAAAIRGIPPRARGRVPCGLPWSPWQVVEHLRRTQRDILDFCRNPRYQEPPMEDYWPPAAAPPSDAAWRGSIAGFRRDLRALKKLAANRKLNLFARVPAGSGQTYLRELLLVADHNAYHVAQLVAVRRALGLWDE